MAAELCVGPAEQAIGAGCAPVEGAQAVYFGADQPRITAETLIPWSALGVSSPAAGMPLHVAIAVTSWDGDRWMSLSGQPPAVALRDLAGWSAMRLGNGPQLIDSTPAPSMRVHG
jgi:hypothetical protein